MTDPFVNNSNSQLIREAQRGIVIVGVLVALLGYIVFYKFGGAFDEVPEHVLNAPVAQTIWPYDQQHQDARSKQLAEDSPKTRRNEQALETRQAQQTDKVPERQQVRPNRIARLDHSQGPFRHDFGESSLSPNNLTPNPTLGLMSTPSATVTSNSIESPVSLPPPITNTTTVQTAGFWEESNEGLDSTDPPKADETQEEKDFGRFAYETEAEQEAANEEPNRSLMRSGEIRDQPTEKRPQINSMESQVFETKDFLPPQRVPIQTAADPTQVEVDTPKLIPPSFENSLPKSTTRRHVVQPGESYWTISQLYFGDGNYFRQLYEFNRGSVGEYESLVPGMTLEIPELAAMTTDSMSAHHSLDTPKEIPPQKKDEVATKHRKHVTQEGETLFSIAADRLGQASRYLEIWELNRSHLPPELDHASPLPANINLTLPEE